VRIKRCLVLGGLVSVLAGSVLSSCTEHGGSRAGFDRKHSSFTPETIQSFSASPLYWLGTRFKRWELSTILGPTRADGTISFIYGTCTPADGEQPSCSPPVEVQVMPLCRHLESVAKDPIWRHRRIRGAPVGRIDNAPVLFSGRAQIKVYALPDPGLAMHALRALRSANHVNPVVNANEAIPAPPAAVLAGTRPCT
jgi:hypothetical protein